MIEIRNRETGEAKTLPTLQAVTDFLADREDVKDWDGHQALGKLPKPSREQEDKNPEENEAPADGAQDEPGEPENPEPEKADEPKKATPVKTVKPAAKKVAAKKGAGRK